MFKKQVDVLKCQFLTQLSWNCFRQQMHFILFYARQVLDQTGNHSSVMKGYDCLLLAKLSNCNF